MNEPIQLERVAMMYFVESYNHNLQSEKVESLMKENTELKKQIEELKHGEK